jgi:hypothetical protein
VLVRYVLSKTFFSFSVLSRQLNQLTNKNTGEKTTKKNNQKLLLTKEKQKKDFRSTKE